MNIKKTSDMVQYEEIDDDDSEEPSSFPKYNFTVIVTEEAKK